MLNKHINKVIDEHFKITEIEDENLFHQLALYIFQMESKDSDLYLLAKLLKQDDLIKVLNYFGGDCLTLPTNEEYRKCVLLAFVFYTKEILGKNWSDIKKQFDLPDKYQKYLNSISIGKKLASIKENLNKDIFNILKNTRKRKMDNIINEVEIWIKKKKV